MAKVFHSETQRMQKLWFWVIGLDLIFCVCIISFVFYNTKSDLLAMLPALAIVLGAFALVVWIFAYSKLIFVIDQEGISYRYPVFRPKWKKISKDDIDRYTIKNYDAIFEYGGHGVKNSKKHGKCVTIKGDIGVLVHLKDGEKILIGTQDKDGVIYAMKQLMQTPVEQQ